MKAQELRIGNYVEYHIIDNIDERKDWWGLSDIDVTDLAILDRIEPDYDYRAIPLTEEWLVKFGIKARIEMPLSLKMYDKNGKTLIKGTPDLKYVHQLQNLYFALTGEELTIKAEQ